MLGVLPDLIFRRLNVLDFSTQLQWRYQRTHKNVNPGGRMAVTRFYLTVFRIDF